MGRFFLEIAGTKRQNMVGVHKKNCSQPTFCNEKPEEAESEGAKGLEALQFVLPLLPF